MNALDLAASAELIPQSEFDQMLREHQRFHSSGGGGGRWQTLDVSGITMGVYQPDHTAKRGTQADLSRRRLDGLNLRDAKLPFANLAGVLCKDQDLGGAVLIGALLVDGDFSGSRFDRAVMKGADLSRTHLRGCSFRGADLERCDFQDCDLTGADFRFAIVSQTRFQGATLTDVQGLSATQIAAGRDPDGGIG